MAAGCLAKEKFWFNRAVTYKSFVSVREPTPVVQTGTFSDLRCVATRVTSPPALSRPSVISRMPACFRPWLAFKAPNRAEAISVFVPFAVWREIICSNVLGRTSSENS